MAGLDDREKMVLRLLFSEIPFEESCMETLLPGRSIDDEKMEYLLMLSLLGIRKRWQHFPEAFRPRLMGIYRYFRVQNLERVPWLRGLLLGLRERGIPVLFLKGIAMRTCYAPDAPRQMYDFDLAVPEERFEEAKAVFLEAGCADTSEGAALHAVTLYHGDFSIDLHRWIFKTGGEKNAGVWENTRPADFHGISVRVLQPEDMVVHTIDSCARDLVTANPTERRLKWLFDVRSVIETEGTADWKKIAERAEKLGSLPYLKMLLPQFSEVFPGTLSREDLIRYFPRDRAYEKWLSRVARYRRESEKMEEAVSLRGDRIYTPYMALREMNHLWTGWRCYFRPELRAAGNRMGFVRYVCHSLKADSPADLVRKYLPAMRRDR